METTSTAYAYAKAAYNERQEKISTIGAELKSRISSYTNGKEANEIKNSAVWGFIFSGIIALISPFVSYWIVNIADIEGDFQNPALFVILFLLAFLATAIYIALHAGHNWLIYQNTQSIRDGISKLNVIKERLTTNFKRNTYAPVVQNIDEEIDAVANTSKALEKNDVDELINASIKGIYWISTFLSFTATAALAARVVLFSLIQNSNGWLTFSIILYYCGSIVALFALYKYLILKEYDENFLYSTRSYVLNVFFELMFTLILCIIWPIALIALAILIIYIIFHIFGG